MSAIRTASVTVAGVTVDCADPAALAEFWGTVLGRPVTADTPDSAAVEAVDPAAGPRMFFQKVPEVKQVKNRLHLDLVTDQHDQQAARLAGLGATQLAEFSYPSLRWTTFADPEGNEFDLLTFQ
jgi:hypothetical protein